MAYATGKVDMRKTLFAAFGVIFTCIAFAIANSPSGTFPGA